MYEPPYIPKFPSYLPQFSRHTLPSALFSLSLPVWHTLLLYFSCPFLHTSIRLTYTLLLYFPATPLQQPPYLLPISLLPTCPISVTSHIPSNRSYLCICPPEPPSISKLLPIFSSPSFLPSLNNSYIHPPTPYTFLQMPPMYQIFLPVSFLPFPLLKPLAFHPPRFLSQYSTNPI